MTDKRPRPPRSPKTGKPPARGKTNAPSRHRGAGGERVAKVIARSGVASRRDAEAMVLAGRVSVNGKAIASPALNIRDSDAVAVDGKPLPKPDAARVWLYHKPAGLVTTEKDEKGRETVFDTLPPELGRVLSIGRLDLTSEGLLLLTNDGALKRRLELPETGWLRRYRVRVNGTPDEAALQRLRDGIVVDGEAFAPMQATLDRQQGANAWLTIGLREGRNREIRRAAEAVGLIVNRLIRVSYGPFQLGTLAAGAVEEVRPRALRDQLGGLFDGELAETRRGDGMVKRDGPRPDRAKGYRGDRDRERDQKGPPRKGAPKPRRESADASEKGFRRRDDAPRKPRDESGSRPDAPDTRKKTRAERKAEMRADTSVSLRKGGQRGKGIAKPKRPRGGKPYQKPGDRRS